MAKLDGPRTALLIAMLLFLASWLVPTSSEVTDQAGWWIGRHSFIRALLATLASAALFYGVGALIHRYVSQDRSGWTRRLH